MKMRFKYLGPVNYEMPLGIILSILAFLDILMFGVNKIDTLPILSLAISWIHVPSVAITRVTVAITIILLFIAIWQIYSLESCTYKEYQRKTHNLRGNLQADPGEVKNAKPNEPYKYTPTQRINKYIRKLIIYPKSHYLIVRIPLPIIYGERMADLIDTNFKSDDNYNSINAFFNNDFPQYYIRFHHYKLGKHNHYIYWQFPHK